ncbi:carbohydrate sulfotransferase 8-like [Haliotis cracherodii]|uniref:carbohydrate sulfotransferase 8-like n=1 Tax=Haliotis cracherodii TaxID=6455 RepID=UPI0039E9437A
MGMKRLVAFLVLGLLASCITFNWTKDHALQLLSPAVSSSDNIEAQRNLKSRLQQSPQMKAQLESRFAQRRKLLKDACNRFGYTPSPEKAKTNQPKYSLCTIEKSGSTFWRHVDNAYKNNADGSKRTRTNNDITIGTGSQMRKSSTMIAFVRNPYTRLFSGYVDKMYCINPFYWKKVGKPALMVVRGNTSRTGSLRCGHDLSFAEFVNYFIYQHDHKQNIDPHFMPISEHCKFCETEYTYIGKLETFRDDMVFVSDTMGMLDYKSTRETILKYGFHDNVYHHCKMQGYQHIITITITIIIIVVVTIIIITTTISLSIATGIVITGIYGTPQIDRA